MIRIRNKNIYPVVHCLDSEDVSFKLDERLFISRVIDKSPLPFGSIKDDAHSDYVLIIRGDVGLSYDETMAMLHDMLSYPVMVGLAAPTVVRSPYVGSRFSVNSKKRAVRQPFCDLSVSLWSRPFYLAAKEYYNILETDEMGWSLPLQIGILAASMKAIVVSDRRHHVRHQREDLRHWSGHAPDSLQQRQMLLAERVIEDSEGPDWASKLIFGYRDGIWVTQKKKQKNRHQQIWEELNVNPTIPVHEGDQV